MGKDFPNTGAQRVLIVGVDKNAEIAIEQCFARPVYFAAEHRNAACQRLQQNNAKPLAAARKNKSVTEPVVIGFFLFGNIAGEHNPVRQIEGPHFFFQTRPVVTVATNQI